MTVRRKFPHRVKVLRDVFIPLSDGTQLAAQIWLPVDAARRPVPAILEYLPYRKRDSTALAIGEAWHRHGVGGMQGDDRGTPAGDRHTVLDHL